MTKISIEFNSKEHPRPSFAYSLDSIKKLYRLEGFRLSTILIDKDNKRKRYYRKRNQMLEDLVNFRHHSFPDLPKQFFPFVNKFIHNKMELVDKKKKTNQQMDKMWTEFFQQGVKDYKQKHPHFTFYDKK